MMDDVSYKTCFVFIKKYKKNELQKQCVVHQSDKMITVMIKKMRLIVMMMLMRWVTTVIIIIRIKPYSIWSKLPMWFIKAISYSVLLQSLIVFCIITICLLVILLLVFMIATFGSDWLINYLNYQGVSQTQNKTLGLPYGSSNFRDKRWFGSVPHRNITFEFQIFHSQYYYGYLRILILIFLIVLRLF